MGLAFSINSGLLYSLTVSFKRIVPHIILTFHPQTIIKLRLRITSFLAHLSETFEELVRAYISDGGLPWGAAPLVAWLHGFEVGGFYCFAFGETGGGIGRLV